jgi:hypothetical protein
VPTNIEQEPHTNQSHQQTSDMKDLQNIMKSLFEQIGTMLNLLTTVANETQILAKFLQLTLWNANSMSQHTEGMKTFISIHNIDVTLISETLFTENSYLKLPSCAAYLTDYPARTT